MLSFITPKAVPGTQWNKYLPGKSRNLRDEPEMDRRSNLFQVVNLKSKHPDDLITVSTNDGLSRSSLLNHFTGLEKQRADLDDKTKGSKHMVVILNFL